MGMEVEVMVDHDGHIFMMPIQSIIQSPKEGDEVVCGKCNKKGKITHVGIPHRTEREEITHPDDQPSLLE